MNKKCWEINPNCMAKAEGPGKRPCPAFEQKINCWELDRAALLNQATAEQKGMMKNWMQENCPKCPTYAVYGDEVDKMIGSCFDNH